MSKRPAPHEPRFADHLLSLKGIAERALRTIETKGIVVYAVHTCWWYLCPSDCDLPYSLPGEDRDLILTLANGQKKTIKGGAIPCDPRGSVLLQTHDVASFLRAAIEKKDHYGRHGLAAFVAAYEGNVVLPDRATLRPTSVAGWHHYNDLLDAYPGTAEKLLAGGAEALKRIPEIGNVDIA